MPAAHRAPPLPWTASPAQPYRSPWPYSIPAAPLASPSCGGCCFYVPGHLPTPLLLLGRPSFLPTPDPVFTRRRSGFETQVNGGRRGSSPAAWLDGKASGSMMDSDTAQVFVVLAFWWQLFPSSAAAEANAAGLACFRAPSLALSAVL